MRESINRVSVVMSLYTEDHSQIEQSVMSIVNQTYKDVELIIADDSPTKDVQAEHELFINDLLKKTSISWKFIKNESNMGLVKSLNKGIEAASGDFIARMDADDEAFPNRLETSMDFMDENDLDFMFGNAYSMTELGTVSDRVMIPFNRKIVKNAELITLLSKGSFSIHSTWLLKKDVFNKVGGYKTCIGAEDFLFLSDAILLPGIKVGYINLPLIKYRVREDSLSRTGALVQYKTAKLLRKRLLNPEDMLFSQPKFDLKRSVRFSNFVKSGMHFKQGKTLRNLLDLLSKLAFNLDAWDFIVDLVMTKASTFVVRKKWRI